MLRKYPYVLGPKYQHVFMPGPELLFPQQQGSHSGDRGQDDGVSQFPSCSQPPCTPQSQCPPPPSFFTISGFDWAEDGCGGVCSSREREGEREAANSWRTAVQLWLSKREKLRETGTKARQLHPLGGLGLPTTSPCFSKPYVHPLPNPTPPPS